MAAARVPWSSADAVGALGLAMLGRQDEAESHAVSWDIAPGDESFRATTWRMARGVVRLTGDDAGRARVDFESVAGSTSRTRLRQRMLALVELSLADFRLGRWDDAVRHADLALSLAVDSGHDSLVPMARATLAGVLAVRGDIAMATTQLEQSTGGDESEAGFIGVRAHAAALLGTVRGAWDDVVVVCSGLERTPGGPLHPALPVQPWPVLLAGALVELGRPEEAEVVVRRFHDRLIDAGRPVMLADATRALGDVAAARGDRAGAEAAYEAAADRLDGTSSPFVAARLAEARGRLALDSRDADAASQHLDRARALYRSLGATPFETRVATMMQGLGAAADSVLAVRLSPRELAVVSLVTTGRTNRQVAAELYVSVKTVEYHLGNVYAKIGVRTRTALAAWWLGRSSRLADAADPPAELAGTDVG